MEDSSKSREHGVSLLLYSGKITADTAKRGDPSRTAKGARNLLLHFRQAKVPLGLVVRKRNPQVVEQSQHLVCTPKQCIQKILGLALLAPAFARSCRRGRWWRLSGIASSQDLEIASDPFVTLDGGNRGQGEQAPLLACFMQIEQEVLHLGGPLLMLLPSDSPPISPQVGAPDPVSTDIGLIAHQSIVHASPCKARPDADLVHGLPTSRRMPCQMRQEVCAVHMQPMKHPIHADAGLISMLEPTVHDQVGNALDRRSQPLSSPFPPPHP